LRRIGQGNLRLSLHLRVEQGALLDVSRVNDPSRHRKRDGIHNEIRVLTNRYVDGNQLLLFESLGRDRSHPFARLIERLGAGRADVDDPRCRFVQLAFAVNLRRRQVARRSGIPRSHADKFADHGQ
jgi:hypothetical protein